MPNRKERFEAWRSVALAVVLLHELHSTGNVDVLEVERIRTPAEGMWDDLTHEQRIYIRELSLALCELRDQQP